MRSLFLLFLVALLATALGRPKRPRCNAYVCSKKPAPECKEYSCVGYKCTLKNKKDDTPCRGKCRDPGYCKGGECKCVSDCILGVNCKDYDPDDCQDAKCLPNGVCDFPYRPTGASCKKDGKPGKCDAYHKCIPDGPPPECPVADYVCCKDSDGKVCTNAPAGQARTASTGGDNCVGGVCCPKDYCKPKPPPQECPNADEKCCSKCGAPRSTSSRISSTPDNCTGGKVCCKKEYCSD